MHEVLLPLCSLEAIDADPSIRKFSLIMI